MTKRIAQIKAAIPTLSVSLSLAMLAMLISAAVVARATAGPIEVLLTSV